MYWLTYFLFGALFSGLHIAANVELVLARHRPTRFEDVAAYNDYNKSGPELSPPCGQFLPPDGFGCETSAKYGNRIINGKPSQTAFFPHHVKIQVKFQAPAGYNSTYNYCGGTIIRDDAVLTNVMCVAPQLCSANIFGTAEKVIVQGVGETGNYGDSLQYEVADVIPHPNFSCIYGTPNDFDYLYTENNIAILKMHDTFAMVMFKERAEINKVCLPPANLDFPALTPEGQSKLTAYIAGWGNANDSDDIVGSKDLRWSVAHVVNATECQRRLVNVPTKVSPTNLCTGTDGDPEDAVVCWGDNGGGLVVKLPGGCRWGLIGIVDRVLVSGGYCKSRILAHEYVALHVDWIEATMKSWGSERGKDR